MTRLYRVSSDNSDWSNRMRLTSSRVALRHIERESPTSPRPAAWRWRSNRRHLRGAAGAIFRAPALLILPRQLFECCFQRFRVLRACTAAPRRSGTSAARQAAYACFSNRRLLILFARSGVSAMRTGRDSIARATSTRSCAREVRRLGAGLVILFVAAYAQHRASTALRGMSASLILISLSQSRPAPH